MYGVRCTVVVCAVYAVCAVCVSCVRGRRAGGGRGTRFLVQIMSVIRWLPHNLLDRFVLENLLLVIGQLFHDLARDRRAVELHLGYRGLDLLQPRDGLVDRLRAGDGVVVPQKRNKRCNQIEPETRSLSVYMRL